MGSGMTFTEHLANLENILVRIRQANMKLTLKKCNLFSMVVKFLGHILSRKGVTTDAEKVKTVKE